MKSRSASARRAPRAAAGIAAERAAFAADGDELGIPEVSGIGRALLLRAARLKAVRVRAWVSLRPMEIPTSRESKGRSRPDRPGIRAGAGVPSSDNIGSMTPASAPAPSSPLTRVLFLAVDAGDKDLI